MGAAIQHALQARRDLGDPARAGLRIIDIAVDNGFVDVTHFHRVFRQTFGCTPAQHRRGVTRINAVTRAHDLARLSAHDSSGH